MVANLPVSRYVELTPPAALSDHVECLWVHGIGAGDTIYEQPVLPDGCIDVVAVGDHVLLAGPATGTTTLRLAPGALTVGVRFRPGAAVTVVGCSARELRDQEIPLDQLWGAAGAELTARAVDPPHWQDRLRVMVEGMTERVRRAPVPDPVGVGIAALLAARRGRPLAEVAEQVGLSERQLRRRVEDSVGYSPRLLARVLRFQRFLRAARAAGAGRSLATLAVDVGYADQAHLTRECGELAGLPPAALLGREAQRLSR
jgi:AraC-like DNA-binding protein